MEQKSPAVRGPLDGEVRRLLKQLRKMGANGFATCREAAETIEQMQVRIEAMHSALAELAATVRGECPSLLDEDSGGSAKLDMAIDAALRPNVEVSGLQRPTQEQR